MIKKLNELQAGQSGNIVSFKGKSDLKRHLMGLGFVKGAHIELRRVAPLGDPIEIRIKGCSISLRKEEAQNIEVELK
ncbi:FeoA family protein [Methanobacterium alcaliphilum]|uniref:FeoA family protein n=1 Tax=Methanobacterium alcaliphilum TaxID=392018 RepID=UPI00200B2517|nr:FeoA family protein [Methanobacterium alcaliphilum]MCK9150370.1 ferrous iron transport protein A [Methanobacterium alcaliphilum]